jgi:putative peptidoglycan lipid II flippase
MVRRVLQMLQREVSGLHEAAYLLAFFAFLSQLLGFVRDRFFAAEFGAGSVLDVYYAAFRLPDIVLATASAVVSVSILIPFLIDKASKGKNEEKVFVDSIFTVFFAGISGISIILFFLVPYIMPVLFPGLNESSKEGMLIMLTRIMLLQPIFLGLSNLFASVTQVYKKFFVYAISPIVYNAGIIIGVLVFYPLWGVSGLAWGVVLGAVFHMAVQLPVLYGRDLVPSFRKNINWKDIKQVVFVSLPRTLALSTSQFSTLFLVMFASVIGTGSIAVFNFAWNLQSVPLVIVGLSYSVAAFPTLVRLFSDGKNDEFMSHIVGAAKQIIFWSLPATILFIVLRAQIVRVILGAGHFSWTDTRLVAASLALFAVSVLAQSMVLLFVRGYYARGETVRPLVVNFGGAILVVVFGIAFMRLFDASQFFRYFVESLLKVSDLPGTKVLMLPLAYSTATLINMGVFWIMVSRDLPGFSARLRNVLFQSFSGSVIMGFATYLFLNLLDDIFNVQTTLGIFAQGLFSGVVGIAVGMMVLYFLGSEDVSVAWRTLHKKMWKAKPIGTDASEGTTL